MDTYLKELDSRLATIQAKFAEELRGVRSGRPSVEMVENIRVNYFDQMLPINQLGSLGVVPPREIRVSVWDKNAVGPIAKAIDDAKIGLSVAVDGNTIHANLSALSNERREELTKHVKKMTEGYRIEVRGAREEAMKGIKGAQDRKEMTEDDVSAAKDMIQKKVDAANAGLENGLNKKIAELSE